MFFDVLWNEPSRVIKAMPHDSSRCPGPSEPQRWISPLIPTRTDSRSPPIEVFANAMPKICLLTLSPDVAENGELDLTDVKRQRLSRLRWRSLFQRQVNALQHKTRGSLSDGEEIYNPVPLHHLGHPSPSNDPPDNSLSLNESACSSQLEQDTPASSPSLESECSSSPSLVPTIIASRPPSPQPHRCIAEAQALGIKVRDFAHENHGVKLAPSIPDIVQLKASYNLYRNAGLTPASEVIRKLQNYDPDWVTEAERRYESLSAQPKPKFGPTILPWRRETEKWRGFQAEESDLANSVHSKETASL